MVCLVFKDGKTVDVKGRVQFCDQRKYHFGDTYHTVSVSSHQYDIYLLRIRIEWYSTAKTKPKGISRNGRNICTVFERMGHCFEKCRLDNFKTKPIARKLRRECQNAAFQPCDLPRVVLVGTPQGTGQNLHETRL